ncbi:protein of unknown function (plasmid) [Cupriavidus neocaledonicus]|uniref:Uncharacterized protein n=1 Tax=Cupriavidus neocaledonicus TaxID=1040979 RepID=A0A375HL95_9BURK|nr:hypothetical protein CBM2605_B10086 [Cupriavidus neocaledonicus]SPD58622.1 protein of unknown function [Cupriavidus neocaledonicus]
MQSVPVSAYPMDGLSHSASLVPRR